MEQIISKEELVKLAQIKGETTGNSIKNTGEFVLKEEGMEGLKKLEETMKMIGFPIIYQQIRATDYYPSSLLAITFVVIERIFKYDDNKFRSMGEFRVKVSIILKILMNYLISLDKAAKEIPKMWRKFFTTGDAKVVELDKKQKKGILRIENYYFHPIQCRVMEGIFSMLIQMIVRSKVACREIKCVHQGDTYHEFLFEW
ncbi:MAG: hypothetical protein ISS83_01720 [Candidatus Pacebacteria bacterium]|nr:hypothetical protein [Candidatus Paceibacterota bacterium]